MLLGSTFSEVYNRFDIQFKFETMVLLKCLSILNFCSLSVSFLYRRTIPLLIVRNKRQIKFIKSRKKETIETNNFILYQCFKMINNLPALLSAMKSTRRTPNATIVVKPLKALDTFIFTIF